MSEVPTSGIDLDLVARHVDKLPSPSAVVVELLQRIDDEDMSSTQLARIIARDQALVVRMLRIANSPFYGLRGRVESIADAIAVLGLRAVRSLAATSAVAGGLAGIAPPGFDTGIFWRHSLAVAIASRALARRVKASEDVAYVAGLLHDIGTLMLASVFPAQRAAVLAHAAEHGLHIADAERELLGIDHAQIGGTLAERWNFPSQICCAISCHHRVSPERGCLLACTVHLGDVLAHALDLAGDPAERVLPISPECWARLALDRESGRRLFADIEREFQALSSALFN